jgi:penicillin-binding protein 1A
LLESGQKVAVSGVDYDRHRRLLDYDVVVLEAVGSSYQLASGTDVQGAVAMVDAETGSVLALVGGFTAGPYGKFAQNNRATNGLRPPGSTVKPFTYLYALNQGVAPDQLLSNAAYQFPKIPNCPYTWSPGNYGGGGGGSMPLNVALQRSVNRAVLGMFVGLTGISKNAVDLRDTSAENVQRLTDTLYGVYDFAASFGAYPDRRRLEASGYKGPCLPFLLGSQETTPLRMAQAYAALGNGGLKRDAVFMKEVLKEDTPLLVDQTLTKREQVVQYRGALKQNLAIAPEAFGGIRNIDPLALAQIRTLLQGVLREGTAARIRKWGDLIGGKTGTTNDSRDVWFNGFSAKVALSVWVGYDNLPDSPYETLGSATGGGVALPIFESVMEAYYQIHPEDLEEKLPTVTEAMGLSLPPPSATIKKRNSR